jgi:molybdopterin-dependent oxidoreductase alpha subunit
MTVPNERKVSAQPPQESEKLHVTKGPKSATGLPSVIKSLGYALEEMGPVRAAQSLLAANQMDGFDCPSCAWPDPEGHRHAIEFCENGAKAIASEATTKRVTPEFFKRWSVSELSTQSDLWLNEQGRLTQPMVLREGADHYERIGWRDAFQLIGQELKSLASPDEAIFYTSGRTSNEAAFLYQLFVRMYGTNNLPDCSNMCHESSGYGLRETIGAGKSTVTLKDLEHTDCIFVIGQNPGTNHPRMLSSLQAAVKNGATIVSVNPLPEVGLQRFKHPQQVLSVLGTGTALAKLLLQVRINGDVALLKGIMKLLVEADAIDHEFIRDYTAGYDAFAAELAEASWDEILKESGVTRAKITEAAEIVKRSKNMIICWAMGLTQHKNAVENVRELVNLLLLRGNIGRQNAGVCCVRGHSNVQGDRTMGIWESMDEGFLIRLGAEFDFDPPRKHGFNTVESIKAMHDGSAKVFVALGGNFLSATPDTAYTAEALKNCKLTVQISTKLNRSHLVTGKTALILPCLGRTEVDGQESGPQFVTVENSMNVVSASKGPLQPASDELMSEPAIVAGIAASTLGGKIKWNRLVADYDLIRDHISSVVTGFDNFNQKVRQPGGFRLDNPASRREFRTASGKANFTVNPIRPIPLRAGEFLMMTIRSHDQFNTTVYGNDDRYRGIRGGRRVVFLNREDLMDAGLTAGEKVDLISNFDGVERTAERFTIVPYEIPRRCAATYFPETNVLVPLDSFADKSGTPTSKSVVIRLKASAN